MYIYAESIEEMVEITTKLVQRGFTFVSQYDYHEHRWSIEFKGGF